MNQQNKKKSEYRIGLSTDQEAVISAHFMHKINQNSDWCLYSNEEFTNKCWRLESNLVVEKLIPILFNKSQQFILDRVAAAEVRFIKNYSPRQENFVKDEVLAYTIVELLCDRQFLKGPKAHISKKNLAEKIKQVVVQKKPIKMVIPALPFKVFSPLKTRGIMPDIAEINFLLDLVEMVKTIDIVYKKNYPELTTTMASFIVICDGKRFNSFLNVADDQIDSYIQHLTQWIKELNIAEYIELVDYKKFVLAILPPKLAEQKKAIRRQVKQLYDKLILPLLNPYHLLGSINQAIALEPDPESSNLEGRFVPLFKSLIYTLNYKKLDQYLNQLQIDGVNLYSELTKHLFEPYAMLTAQEYQKIDSHFDNPTWLQQQASVNILEYLRQEMIKEAWIASINYIAEIRSDRDLMVDPVTVCFSECIRWTIHAKPGQLALLTTTAFGEPVQPWHGCGVFMKTKKNKIKLYTVPVLALEGEGAIPVVLDNHQKQALFYIHPNVGCKNPHDFFDLLNKQLTRQRKN